MIIVTMTKVIVKEYVLTAMMSKHTKNLNSNTLKFKNFVESS